MHFQKVSVFMKTWVYTNIILSIISLAQMAFAHLVLLNCKQIVNFDILKRCFLTIRILSNLSQSPGNVISETLNLKISLGLRFQPPPIKKSFLRHWNTYFKYAVHIFCHYSMSIDYFSSFWKIKRKLLTLAGQRCQYHSGSADSCERPPNLLRVISSYS